MQKNPYLGKFIVFEGLDREDGAKLVEYAEINGGVSVGTQSHPEFKSRLQDPSPLFYGFINTLGATIILFIIATLTNKNFSSSTKNNLKGFSLLGILQTVAFICYTIALNTGIVSYVLAIKSSAAILGSVLGVIFLKEKLTKPKTAALFFIFLGLIFIALA